MAAMFRARDSDETRSIWRGRLPAPAFPTGSAATLGVPSRSPNMWMAGTRHPPAGFPEAGLAVRPVESGKRRQDAGYATRIGKTDWNLQVSGVSMDKKGAYGWIRSALWLTMRYGGSFSALW
ncbi:hypothetical protein [Teichococcus aestuarii]|uniref:hypothetical protein n=1 Tax=Teichococcus aestuarii TaxID=568898 RepID=UPI0011B1D034|nr:hypothetical protein [Pseudoroseomonas aestuarii]